jgi:hypothetical protein
VSIQEENVGWKTRYVMWQEMKCSHVSKSQPQHLTLRMYSPGVLLRCVEVLRPFCRPQPAFWNEQKKKNRGIYYTKDAQGVLYSPLHPPSFSFTPVIPRIEKKMNQRRLKLECLPCVPVHPQPFFPTLTGVLNGKDRRKIIRRRRWKIIIQPI